MPGRATRHTVNSLLQRSIVPFDYEPASRTGVIVLGGWKATVDTITDDGVRDYLYAGYPTITCAVDETWGNSTMRTRLSTLKTNAQASLFASGKVHGLGISMGGLCLLNMAKANPDLFASLALIVPAANPQRLYDEDPLAPAGIRASISAAFGGRPPDAETPTKNAASFAGIPGRIYYSQTDTINTVPADTTDFAEAAGWEVVNMGDAGHGFGPPLSVNGVSDNREIVRFFDEHD